MSKEDLARMLDEGDEASGRKPTMVIVYDAAGQRSAEVAESLSGALNGKVVYSLAGGVVRFIESLPSDEALPMKPFLRVCLHHLLSLRTEQSRRSPESLPRAGLDDADRVVQ